MENLLKKLLSLLLNCSLEDKLPQPTSTKVISIEDLYNLLRRKFPEAKAIYLSKPQYILCNQKDIEIFLKYDQTDKFKYDKMGYRCADYAYRLMGEFSIPQWSELAIGIVWTDNYTHALNCFTREDGKHLYIEPQTDKIQEVLEDWQGKEIGFIAM